MKRAIGALGPAVIDSKPTPAYEDAVSSPHDASDVAITPVHIDVDVRLLEHALALDALSRREAPVEYAFRTVGGVALFGATVAFVANARVSALTPLVFLLFGFTALSIIPWVLRWSTSWWSPPTPFTITGLVPNGMRYRVHAYESEMRFGSTHTWIENESSFVVSSVGYRASVIPKRVFASSALLHAFREAIFAAPVTEPIRAIGVDPSIPSVRYTFTPEELVKTVKLLLWKRITAREGLLGAFAAALIVFVSYAFDPGYGFLGVVVLVITVYNRFAPLMVSVKSVRQDLTWTVELDSEVLRVSEPWGSTSYAWAASKRIVENDEILIVVLDDKGGGISFPKRILSDEVTALIRRRVTLSRS